MKISYVANIRFPTEKAHGVQIAKMCEAFALAGHEVELLVPRRTLTTDVDPFTYYAVDRVFTVTYLPSLNVLALGAVGFWLQSLFFSQMAIRRIRRMKPDVVFSREEAVLINYYFLGLPVIWEAHRGTFNWITRRILHMSRRVVVISNGLRDLYTNAYPACASKILVAPDAVDIALFDNKESKDGCRQALQLPRFARLALYNGHLYDWKGVDTLAQAAADMKPDEFVVFVGGTGAELENFKKKYGHLKQCVILGQQPYSSMPRYMRAADVGVIPNSAREKIGSTYTSPLKLFEFMASGLAIVSTDIPAVREVLNDERAFFVKPDDAQDMLRGLREAWYGRDVADERRARARAFVEDFSWLARARAILSIFTNHEINS